jgi:F420-non-reducing hydrogenase iron-sulfur subunit
MSDDGFEPRIIGFLCNWCSYQGADMAGMARIRYAPNVDVIRVNCSGRVEPAFIFKAFREGADGVIVAGCHPGDCHYTSGNFKTMRRMPLVHRLLAEFGIEPARFRLEWVSAAEGGRWARIVNEMTAQVRRLGPLRWGEQLAGEPSRAPAVALVQPAGQAYAAQAAVGAAEPLAAAIARPGPGSEGGG